MQPTDVINVRGKCKDKNVFLFQNKQKTFVNVIKNVILSFAVFDVGPMLTKSLTLTE